nr:uncharacterized protein CTRU02_12608 [Colletotrichum truncatum]KAF6784346.1 hypothetical protein CTRU02_12608 [Colletotrichum truncatum]
MDCRKIQDVENLRDADGIIPTHAFPVHNPSENTCESPEFSEDDPDSEGDCHLGSDSGSEALQEPGPIMLTVATKENFTIEELSDFDPMDQDRTGFIGPSGFSSPACPQSPPPTTTMSNELPNAFLQDMRSFNFSESSSDSDESDSSATFTEFARVQRERRKQRKAQRSHDSGISISNGSSFGKRTVSERSDSDNEDLALFNPESVGSTARRLRRRVGDRRSFLSMSFQDPPPPRINELEEPESETEDTLPFKNREKLARELPYWSVEIMDYDSNSDEASKIYKPSVEQDVLNMNMKSTNSAGVNKYHGFEASEYADDKVMPFNLPGESNNEAKSSKSSQHHQVATWMGHKLLGDSVFRDKQDKEWPEKDSDVYVSPTSGKLTAKTPGTDKRTEHGYPITGDEGFQSHPPEYSTHHSGQIIRHMPNQGIRRHVPGMMLEDKPAESVRHLPNDDEKNSTFPETPGVPTSGNEGFFWPKQDIKVKEALWEEKCKAGDETERPEWATKCEGKACGHGGNSSSSMSQVNFQSTSASKRTAIDVADANELLITKSGIPGELQPGPSQTQQIQQTQNCSSMETSSVSSATFDSSSASEAESLWLLSECSEEPPALNYGHPFLKLKDVALRVTLESFRIWRECTAESDTPTTGESTTSQDKKSDKVSRKRHRNPDSNETPDNGDADQDSNQKTTTKRRRTTEKKLTFACPFSKKDPMKHRDCYKYMLNRIRDVKQHLARCHRVPPYCPRCMATFSDEDARDGHIRDEDCPKRTFVKLDGVTDSQRSQLAKKAPSNQSKEDQWFGVYDILFLGQPRPASPYIDNDLLQDITLYQDYLSTNGPTILSEILTSRGAVTWNLPNEEQDLAAFQRSIFEEGLREIFQRWASQNGISLAQETTQPTEESSSRVEQVTIRDFLMKYGEKTLIHHNWKA